MAETSIGSAAPAADAGRQAAASAEEVVPRRRRPLVSSMRARILGWYVVLLVLAMAIAIAGSRNVQLTSLDKHLDRVLDHEVQDLRLLAEGGTDPATGRPFTGVRQLFLAQLGRRAPPRNEIMVTFVDGRPFLRSADPPPARLAPTPA